jgi:hypothetical protein
MTLLTLLIFHFGGMDTQKMQNEGEMLLVQQQGMG